MNELTPPDGDTILIEVIECADTHVLAWALVAAGLKLKTSIPIQYFGGVCPIVEMEFWWNMKTKTISTIDWDSDPEYQRIGAEIKRLCDEHHERMTVELDDLP